jgi:hypothetical protein
MCHSPSSARSGSSSRKRCSTVSARSASRKTCATGAAALVGCPPMGLAPSGETGPRTVGGRPTLAGQPE